MSKLSTAVTVLIVFTASALSALADNEAITQDELVRRTLELVDAVAVGNQTPWKQYFADDATFFDEKGRSMDKAALVGDITPLPKGSSGSIKIAKAQSHILGHTAILTYDLDETEIIYGQNMTARYHETDTWMFRDGRWQIVAGQVLRYYDDPAAGKIDVARLNDHIGTYELARGVTRSVSREGNKLYSKRGERPQELLVPETCDLFFRPGVEGRFLFRRNDSGQVDALIDRRNNEDVVWKKL
jgi:hypothetical protein